MRTHTPWILIQMQVSTALLKKSRRVLETHGLVGGPAQNTYDLFKLWLFTGGTGVKSSSMSKHAPQHKPDRTLKNLWPRSRRKVRTCKLSWQASTSTIYRIWLLARLDMTRTTTLLCKWHQTGRRTSMTPIVMLKWNSRLRRLSVWRRDSQHRCSFSNSSRLSIAKLWLISVYATGTTHRGPHKTGDQKTFHNRSKTTRNSSMIVSSGCKKSQKT